MDARDPHRSVNELDETAIERLIVRLEGRAKDAGQLAPHASAHVLEVECGMGASTKAVRSSRPRTVLPPNTALATMC